MATRRAAAPFIALLLVLAVAVPAAAAEPVAPAAADGAPAATRPYELLLHRGNDFVAQTNFVQCVGASMQMMLNMMEPGADRTAKTQLRLQVLARGLSGQRPDGRVRQGASVRGWSAGLNKLGAGPYAIVGEETIQLALQRAAKAIRITGKPVGLLVWRGRHAWVMTGFRATADPATTDDFRVTAVSIMDPLYPYGSKTWGPSPRPGDLLTLKELGRQFVQRRTSSQSAIWAGGTDMSRFSGKYVIVMPYEAPRLSSRTTLAL